jgi:hypothetical protein
MQPKSPEPSAVGAVNSAVAVHTRSRRWLSYVRQTTHMASARTRWLLGGGSVLLPLLMFACLWVVTMVAPSVRVPGGSIYICLLVAIVVPSFVIFTAPISLPHRVALLFGALLVLGVQVLALGWLAMQFSKMEGIQ